MPDFKKIIKKEIVISLFLMAFSLMLYLTGNYRSAMTMAYFSGLSVGRYSVEYYYRNKIS